MARAYLAVFFPAMLTEVHPICLHAIACPLPPTVMVKSSLWLVHNRPSETYGSLGQIDALPKAYSLLVCFIQSPSRELVDPSHPACSAAKALTSVRAFAPSSTRCLGSRAIQPRDVSIPVTRVYACVNFATGHLLFCVGMCNFFLLGMPAETTYEPQRHHLMGLPPSSSLPPSSRFASPAASLILLIHF